MAEGHEKYLDAVVAAITADRLNIPGPPVNVYDEIDWEENVPNKSTDFPTIQIGEGPTTRTQENQNYKTFRLRVLILVNLASDKQAPAKYNAARAMASDIEDYIAEEILRNVSGFEEPDNITSIPGLIRVGNRKVYGVAMEVETLTPFIR